MKRGRLVLLVFSAVVIAAATWRFPELQRLPTFVALLCEQSPAILPIPVEGVAPRSLSNTWGAARSGGRRHEGIDIFGPRGGAVYSVTRGIVDDVGTNRLGGKVVWVLGPGGHWHYYAHLDNYGAITRGDVIAAGTIVGYVGDSGNAKGTPPHLHYGIYTFTGEAMNPFPLLVSQRSP
jgi:murein DD-endopeptidase MepM/ murein hydrolase activator NlpD